ncbi:two-component system, NarL family, sensor histidine kinase EvgS [Pseudomonas sp. ok272]|uniref:transporter substrate-binding domain-containing protein n=1 Tax=unclassified Pseudomonas TaxID=196821 RepID=UPI0008D7FD37|nr:MULTISPECIES: transporter substrate-binding domain-containing protein [unclassified Pseudomonas]SEM33265.1 two-component system, NarL family, sensor histidine kinase EvgS [Pseudomonas sp. ok272]SFM33095.1 two-component system, NarL family, sensor histidine kinase EvgS [Pseudomonas sp. ok602]
MRFFLRLQPALRWVIVLGVLASTRGVSATQLNTLNGAVEVASASLGLDAQERAWIAEHPRVIVASVQYPLYLFKDEQGQWNGLNNDILQRISSMTGIEFVHEESFSTDHLLGLLESGRADMSTTLAANEERQTFLDFTHAFGGSGWVFVGRSGAVAVHSLADLSGKVLALPTRHALETGIRADYPQIQLRSVKTYAEARALVESGEAYATIENETGAYLYPAGRLLIGSRIEGKWEADKLALRKGQPHLLSILNKALEAFSAAELRAMRFKWLGSVLPSKPPTLWQRVYLWGCWGAVVASLFTLLSLLWGRRLKRQVEQQRNVERQLSDQLAFQATLINAMPDPVFVRDLEGRLIQCNKSYEDRLSTRFDQVQGKRLTEVDTFPIDTARLLHGEIMEQLSHRKGRFVERRLLFKCGVRDVYQWTVPFYSADGLLQGVVGGWREIGERPGEARD